MRTRLSIVVALLLALGAGGCGGGKDERKRDNAYVDAFNVAQRRFDRTVKGLPMASERTSRAQDRRALAGYEAAVRRVVGDLRRITPPDSVAPLHRRFVESFERFGVVVRQAAAAVRSGKLSAVLDAQTRLAQARDALTKQVGVTVAAINKKLA